MREKVIFSLCRILFSSKHTLDLGVFLELAYLRSLGAHWFDNAWFDINSIDPSRFDSSFCGCHCFAALSIFRKL